MIDITEIVIGFIGILMALITSVLIPYIKSKTSSDQYNQIQIWASAAVKAAEQKYSGSGKGKEKKEYVLKYLTSLKSLRNFKYKYRICKTKTGLSMTWTIKKF